MAKILYIHGFKSSENSTKSQLLRRHFTEVVSPTLPVSPRAAIPFLEKILWQEKIDFLIGSSLGGFYAFLLLKKHKIPALLINPSLKPWQRLENQIGRHTRFSSEETFEWTQEHNRELLQLHQEAEKLLTPEHLLNFFVATDDELIDHSYLPQKFAQANIQFFDKRGHIFVRFTPTISQIKQIIDDLKVQ